MLEFNHIQADQADHPYDCDLKSVSVYQFEEKQQEPEPNMKSGKQPIRPKATVQEDFSFKFQCN